MQELKFDLTNAQSFVKLEDLEKMAPLVKAAHDSLHSKTGLGSDAMGWVDLPLSYDKTEYARIKLAAEKIRSESEALIVIGIGGSYLGSRAAVSALTDSFGANIYFMGTNLSPLYTGDLLDHLKDKELSVNVISKSGTTTEPALALRLVRELMQKKYGRAGASKRIYATTDCSKGALKGLADQEGYETFVIPDDIGGRYSVLTAVGLLPMAAAGIDTDAMLTGAGDACKKYNNQNIYENDCCLYAAARNILYNKGKTTEILVNYEPSLHYFSEWWKQLFGESEGKDQKGIFPAAMDFTTDLHSMGQYVQDGLRNLFETVINVEKPRRNILIEKDPGLADGLKYLEGMDLDQVNKKAMMGTVMAHVQGGTPNLMLSVPEMNGYWFGQLIYFFEKACGISGRLLGVNPFDQPGVEEYKRNMFALLGKPGFEDLRLELDGKIK